MITKTVLSMFPIVDSALISETKSEICTFRIFYTKDRQEFPLHLEKLPYGGNGQYTIRDPTAHWSPDHGDFYVAGTIKIDHPDQFFSKLAVAEENSKIGIALLAFSPGWRKTISVGNFGSQHTSFNLDFKCGFEKNIIRNNIKFRLVFFLLRSPSNKKVRFASVPGTILGKLEEYNLIVEGAGSKFPILINKDGKNEPLWRIFFANGVTVLHKFEDTNVAIVLNEDHRAFKSLGIGASIVGDSFFLLEVIASAMQIIFEKFKDEYSAEIVDLLEEDLRREEFNGTIFKLIWYHKGLSALEFREPEKLALNIRRIIDRRYSK